MSIRDAMRNPICTNCGGPAMIGDVSLKEQHLRIKNVRLKDELDRVCAFVGKFLERPILALATSMPNSSLELGVGNNGFGGLNTVTMTLPLDFGSPLSVIAPAKSTMNAGTLIERSLERSMYLELALVAMEERVKIAQRLPVVRRHIRDA
ncbi:Homeobox-leucine zipper family protein / lipid-binding START domain-containing protein [Perilla frutescens var. frutescens]|nr:Homeobox-leucine zipper family protein / lipid-binding START domain-containing protein [Perilla frutescens var. frutescens]